MKNLNSFVVSASRRISCTKCKEEFELDEVSVFNINGELVVSDEISLERNAQNPDYAAKVLCGECELFEECMEEAEKLCNEFFSPEIDNLADQSIESIIMKVVIEQDIYTEGHLEGIPDEEGEKWMKQSNTFLNKWKPKAQKEG